jgi:hypothetical protein
MADIMVLIGVKRGAVDRPLALSRGHLDIPLKENKEGN